MAFNIVFWRYGKKHNSTDQPPISSGVSYTGTLRGEFGMTTPVIDMSFGNTAPNYNYAYISEFGRYYWVTEITSIGGGLWRVNLRCDVLASFKTQIGNSVKYVLRSASSFDGAITDMKYPTKTTRTVTNRAVFTPWSNPNNWCYLIGVLSNEANTFDNSGALTIYALSEGDMTNFKQEMMGGTNYYNSITDTDLRNAVIKLTNPFDYLVFCRWIPVDVRDQLNKSFMRLGGFVTANQYCKAISTVYTQTPATLVLGTHAEAATRGSYMNYEPYTVRYLNTVSTGFSALPLAGGVTEIKITRTLDLVNSISHVEVFEMSPTQNKLIYETNMPLGVNIPMAQMISGNPFGIVSGAMNLFGAGVSAMMGNVSGAVQGTASAIGNFISSVIPEVESMKTTSGILIDTGVIGLTEVFYDVAGDDNLNNGRPLCQRVAINTLSGYVLCADGEINAAGAYESELEEIARYMTGGFYYE